MNYEELHQQYYHRILRYLSRIVGQTDAEDLAQEVFATASTTLSSLREPSKASPWLFKIALNRARDMLRRRKSEGQNCNRLQSAGSSSAHKLESQPDPLAQVRDTRGSTPDERLEYSEMVECYLDFVGQLPTTYFEVYSLSEFEELDDATISKRLQLPLSTVKMRLHRARAKLHENLRSHCRCYLNERGHLMGTLK